MNKIMFNTKCGLEQAVLESRKTMTRRIFCPKVWEKYFEYKRGYAEGQQNLLGGLQDSREYLIGLSPYEVGEVVAIAQSYKAVYNEYLDNKEIAKADTLEMGFGCSKGWNNKMFVRANLMLHHIKITDVRVEQLQDISNEDCIREGIMDGGAVNAWDRYYFNSKNDIPSRFAFKTPHEAFAALIDKTSGKGTWRSNPWVFCYSFELID